MSLTWSELLAASKSKRKTIPRSDRREACAALNVASDDLLISWCKEPRPNVASLIRKLHPKPESEARAALYQYLLAKDVEINGPVKEA